MWEDFLCPACQQWNAQVEPQLFEEEIQSGRVKMEYNYLPLQSHGPGAYWGAVAAECANEQEAFWPYHDRLFQLASTQGQTAFSTDRLVGHAADLGLDREAFNVCLTSGEHQATVDASLRQAGRAGRQQHADHAAQRPAGSQRLCLRANFRAVAQAAGE